MAQLGKVSPTTAVKAFGKGAPSGGSCARAANGGPAKPAVSFLAVHALGPTNEDRLSRPGPWRPTATPKSPDDTNLSGVPGIS